MNAQLGMGMMEILLVMMFGLPMGISPGERDSKLIQCAPADTVFYAEAAPLSQPAPTKLGWDGFLQDDEVQVLIKDVKESVHKLEQSFKQAPNVNDQEQVGVVTALNLAQTIPGSASSLFVFLRKPTESEKPKDWMKSLHGALICNVGDQADAIEASILKSLRFYNRLESPKDWDKLDLSKMNELIIPLPWPDTQPLILHRTGGYISLSYGETAHQHVIKGLAGESQGFAESQNYHEKVKPQFFARQSQFAFLDVKKLLQGLVKIAPEESLVINSSLSLLGLQKVEGLTFCSGLVEGQVQTRSLLWTNGELNGLLSLLQGPGLKLTDLEHLPADIDLAVAYSFDAPAIFQSIKQLVTAADQNSAEIMNQMITSLEELLEVSLTEDLLPALGHAVVIHDAPSQGGLLVTSPVLKLSLKKPEIMEKVLNKMCQIMKANNTSNYPYEFHTREFLGQKIYNFGYDRDDDFMIHLSWTFTKDSMYLALHPSTLKAQLRLVKDEKMLKLPASTLKLFTADTPVISCTYLNLKESMHVLYTFLPYALTGVNNEFYQEVSDETFDIQDALSIYSLPSIESIKRYDAPSWSIVTREKSGIKVQTQISVSGAITTLIPTILMFAFRVM